jgi:hypothetical protein
MAIHFNTKPAVTLPPRRRKPGPKTGGEKTITEQKKAAARAKRIQKHYKKRLEVTEEFNREMDGRHIPNEVEDAIDAHILSAQEIIKIWETLTGESLGPKRRKYVVANLFASQLGSDKAPGANQYCDAVADLVLERMCNGESVNHICKDPFMPNISKFFAWLTERPELKEKYTLAQQVLGYVAASRVVEVSGKARMGVSITHRADGTVDIVTADMVQRSRLEADSLKWYASKVLPQFSNEGAQRTSAVPGQQTATGGRTITVTGGLPRKPLGELPPGERDAAVAEAAKTRVITQEMVNNPFGLDIAAIEAARKTARNAPAPSADPADYDDAQDEDV